MANARTTATTLIPNNKTPLSQQKVFLEQENPTKNQNAHRDVRQDKRGFTRARIASPQPARSDIPMRAEHLTNKTQRSQNRPDHKKRTVQLTLWVEPIVKAEIQRRAERENLSVSSAGAAFLRKGMQTDLDMQYGALLKPVLESLFDRRMSARDNRLALLLVRVALDAGQTRNLVTNILGRQPGISPEVLNDILDRSVEDAKRKITRRSPELEELIKEVKSWLTDEEKKKD